MSVCGVEPVQEQSAGARPLHTETAVRRVHALRRGWLSLGHRGRGCAREGARGQREGSPQMRSSSSGKGTLSSTTCRRHVAHAKTIQTRPAYYSRMNSDQILNRSQIAPGSLPTSSGHSQTCCQKSSEWVTVLAIRRASHVPRTLSSLAQHSQFVFMLAASEYE